MINKKIGDLLVEVQPEFGIAKFIVHGTNCQGAFKSGFAGQMRKVYPNAYHSYMRAHHCIGLKLGETTVCGNDRFMIYNANTQEYYGRDPSVQYVSYEAVRSCFKEINEDALASLYQRITHADGTYESINIVEIHFPLIGCGLGNGDWDIISGIIEEELDPKLDVYLWVLPNTKHNTLNTDLFS